MIDTDRRRKELRDLVGHPGFAHVQAIFADKIMDLQSILNLDVSSPEKMVEDVRLRGLLINELKEILETIQGEAVAQSYHDVVDDERDLFERE